MLVSGARRREDSCTNVAEWSRGSMEASVKRADAGYRLLGRVPFAEDEALDRSGTEARPLCKLGTMTT